MLATPPGRAQSSVDPVALAKAKELLAVSNVVAMRDQIAALLQRQIAALIQQANPGQEAQVDQAVKELIQPALEQRIPEFLDAAAAIYAKYFTRDELAQLVAFYKSPVAQKLTHVAPEITDLMRDWPNRVGNDILKQSAADLRKRGLKLPGA
jgi:hypothetical protein